jgi:uncharacterized repeat protein (TIGR03833 family)
MPNVVASVAWNFVAFSYNTKGVSGGQFMDGTRRSDIVPGLRVSIVLKKDQKTGRLTKGTVKDILTNSPTHTHGIKVRLESGEVGRVKEIFD